MSCSAYQALQSLQPELSASLIDERARPGLLALAHRLPELGGSHYLECRLGAEASPQVDLLVAISRLAQRPELRESSRLSRGLQPLRRMLEHWGRPSTLAHEAVPMLWVEFDDVRHQEEPRANVCACIVPSYVDPTAPIASLPPESQPGVLGELVGIIRGTPCTEAEQAHLGRCVRLLPPGAHWIHLSVMTERSPTELKLYGAFPRHSLPGYLAALGWPGERSDVERLLERYFPAKRTGALLYVDLPLTRVFDHHEPALGICFSRQHLTASEERDPRRLPLLSQLTEDGLCSPSQAEALVAWSRVSVRRSSNPWNLERWFDVKLVMRPGAPLLAKAYLGFSSPTASQRW